MTIDEQFELIFQVGSHVCASYTGFTQTEIAWCQSKSNWQSLQGVVFSTNPYEAMIMLGMNQLQNVVVFFQLFVACSLTFELKSADNDRLDVLLQVIDADEDVLESALKNTRLIRALLAVAANHNSRNSSRNFWLYYNTKRILAHIFKKHPAWLKLNVLRTNSKTKKLRFTEEDVENYF